jgi:hypothetical protein
MRQWLCSGLGDVTSSSFGGNKISPQNHQKSYRVVCTPRIHQCSVSLHEEQGGGSPRFLLTPQDRLQPVSRSASLVMDPPSLDFSLGISFAVEVHSRFGLSCVLPRQMTRPVSGSLWLSVDLSSASTRLRLGVCFNLFLVDLLIFSLS